MRVPLHLLAFILPVLPVAAAQQESSFAAHANLVPVPALVRDASGNPVYGLHADDFIIEDDGKPQNVHLEESTEGGPLSIMIALQRGRRARREFGVRIGLKIRSDGRNRCRILTTIHSSAML